MNDLQAQWVVVLLQAVTDPIWALASAAVVLLSGCTTVSDHVRLGTFEYSHQEISISGIDSVNMAGVLTAPSFWNLPVVKTTCDTVVNWIFGGQD